MLRLMWKAVRVSPKARAIALGVAALAAVVIGGSAMVVAQQTSGITDARARAIALEHVPGTVLDLEREDGEIELEVRGEDGRVHEVTLDERDGRVITIEADDAADDEAGGDDD